MIRGPIQQREVDVLVVGAGPSGLAVAKAIAESAVGTVEVLDREPLAGGLPKYSRYPGFGWRDMRRWMTGEEYADRWARAAREAGAHIRTGVTVVSVGSSGRAQAGFGRALTSPPVVVDAVSPQGRERITAKALVLATGARERSVVSRWLPGGHAAEAMTLGAFQRLMESGQVDSLEGSTVVVVGAEHVSYAAVWMLAGLGARVSAMVTDQPRHQTWSWLRWVTTMRHRPRLLTNTRVTRIMAEPSVRGLEIERKGRLRELPCDLVIFTGQWVPDAEVAELADLTFDQGTQGPTVDAQGRTSRPGVFAVGNLVHPALAADRITAVAAAVAPIVVAHVHDGLTQTQAGVPLAVGEGLQWVWPQAIDPLSSVMPQVNVWPTVCGHWVSIEVSQAGRVLHRLWLPEIVSHRVHRLRSDWVKSVDPAGGPVRLKVSKQGIAQDSA